MPPTKCDMPHKPTERACQQQLCALRLSHNQLCAWQEERTVLPPLAEAQIRGAAALRRVCYTLHL
jgi:hypothetical protein